MRSRNCWWRAGRLIRALGKFLALLAASLVTTSAQAAPESSTVVSVTSVAAISCILAVSKQGATKDRFSKSGDWVVTQNGDGFHHSSMPVAVSFPKDADGIARNCEVRATLASQDDQERLTKILKALIGAAPIEQQNSIVWAWNPRVGPRGLQLYPDRNSDQPQVRLVVAAF